MEEQGRKKRTGHRCAQKRIDNDGAFRQDCMHQFPSLMTSRAHARGARRCRPNQRAVLTALMNTSVRRGSWIGAWRRRWGRDKDVHATIGGNAYCFFIMSEHAPAKRHQRQCRERERQRASSAAWRVERRLSICAELHTRSRQGKQVAREAVEDTPRAQATHSIYNEREHVEKTSPYTDGGSDRTRASSRMRDAACAKVLGCARPYRDSSTGGNHCRRSVAWR